MIPLMITHQISRQMLRFLNTMNLTRWINFLIHQIYIITLLPGLLGTSIRIIAINLRSVVITLYSDGD
jgi:hypothetical protein